MRILIFAALLLPQLSLAAQKLSCELNAYYPRMEILSDKEHVRVRVVSPRGYESLPQWEAPMPIEWMKYMDMQGKDLAGLGSEFIYEWKRSQCEFAADDAWLISCTGGTKSSGTDNGILARLFTTARIDEKSLSGKHSVLRLRFVFEKQNFYFTAIPFPTEKCKLEEISQPAAAARR